MFNIRAMSLVQSIPADARMNLAEIPGKEFRFRSGLSYSTRMPVDAGQFARVAEPERVFTALDGWARVYGYRNDQTQLIHVLAQSENEDGHAIFYRLDLAQPIKSSPGPRPGIEILAGAVMGYDDCASWLIDLAVAWDIDKTQGNLRFVLRRPAQFIPTPIRVAWVVPEAAENQPIAERLSAIGKVYGVEIVHVVPRGLRDTQARLAKAMPYESAVICRHYARHIMVDAIPEGVPRNLIHFCDSSTRAELESQIRAWIELSVQEVEASRKRGTVQEERFLLVLMLRAMLSHSKVGEFNHCPKETVLKVIRGRRLNVPAAEGILDQHSEVHGDTKTSELFFLWKGHHDGRQYFLNPRRVDAIKAFLEGR